MSPHIDDQEWLRRQMAAAETRASGVDGGGGDAPPDDWEDERTAAENQIYSDTGDDGHPAHSGGADYGGVTRAEEDSETDTDAVVILDDAGAMEPVSAVDAQRVRRFDHKVAARLGAVAAGGVIAAVVGAVAFYGGGHPAQRERPPPSVADPAAAAATVPAPATTSDDTPGGDRPLTYTATADCPPGSTSAQTLAGADPLNAFVCVRDGVDGQVVNIDLGKTYVISAISITPGWIGKDSSGMSQWAQHRVVTRVQYMLTNGDDMTMIRQDTGNVHGEAVQPVKRVLASKVKMLILQTSRPPAEASSTTAAPGAPLGGVLGTFDPPAPAPPESSPAPVPGGDANSTDPVDAGFAISNLKIIGHEAI